MKMKGKNNIKKRIVASGVLASALLGIGVFTAANTTHDLIEYGTLLDGGSTGTVDASEKDIGPITPLRPITKSKKYVVEREGFEQWTQYGTTANEVSTSLDSDASRRFGRGSWMKGDSTTAGRAGWNSFVNLRMVDRPDGTKAYGVGVVFDASDDAIFGKQDNGYADSYTKAHVARTGFKPGAVPSDYPNYSEWSSVEPIFGGKKALTMSVWEKDVIFSETDADGNPIPGPGYESSNTNDVGNMIEDAYIFSSNESVVNNSGSNPFNNKSKYDVTYRNGETVQFHGYTPGLVTDPANWPFDNDATTLYDDVNDFNDYNHLYFEFPVAPTDVNIAYESNNQHFVNVLDIEESYVIGEFTFTAYIGGELYTWTLHPINNISSLSNTNETISLGYPPPRLSIINQEWVGDDYVISLKYDASLTDPSWTNVHALHYKLEGPNGFVYMTDPNERVVYDEIVVTDDVANSESDGIVINTDTGQFPYQTFRRKRDIDESGKLGEEYDLTPQVITWLENNGWSDGTFEVEYGSDADGDENPDANAVNVNSPNWEIGDINIGHDDALYVDIVYDNMYYFVDIPEGNIQNPFKITTEVIYDATVEGSNNGFTYKDDAVNASIEFPVAAIVEIPLVTYQAVDKFYTDEKGRVTVDIAYTVDTKSVAEESGFGTVRSDLESVRLLGRQKGINPVTEEEYNWTYTSDKQEIDPDSPEQEQGDGVINGVITNTVRTNGDGEAQSDRYLDLQLNTEYEFMLEFEYGRNKQGYTQILRTTPFSSTSINNRGNLDKTLTIGEVIHEDVSPDSLEFSTNVTITEAIPEGSLFTDKSEYYVADVEEIRVTDKRDPENEGDDELLYRDTAPTLTPVEGNEYQHTYEVYFDNSLALKPKTDYTFIYTIFYTDDRGELVEVSKEKAIRTPDRGKMPPRVLYFDQTIDGTNYSSTVATAVNTKYLSGGKYYFPYLGFNETLNYLNEAKVYSDENGTGMYDTGDILFGSKSGLSSSTSSPALTQQINGYTSVATPNKTVSLGANTNYSLSIDLGLGTGQTVAEWITVADFAGFTTNESGTLSLYEDNPISISGVKTGATTLGNQNLVDEHYKSSQARMEGFDVAFQLNYVDGLSTGSYTYQDVTSVKLMLNDTVEIASLTQPEIDALATNDYKGKFSVTANEILANDYERLNLSVVANVGGTEYKSRDDVSFNRYDFTLGIKEPEFNSFTGEQILNADQSISYKGELAFDVSNGRDEYISTNISNVVVTAVNTTNPDSTTTPTIVTTDLGTSLDELDNLTENYQIDMTGLDANTEYKLSANVTYDGGNKVFTDFATINTGTRGDLNIYNGSWNLSDEVVIDPEVGTTSVVDYVYTIDPSPYGAGDYNSFSVTDVKLQNGLGLGSYETVGSVENNAVVTDNVITGGVVLSEILYGLSPIVESDALGNEVKYFEFRLLIETSLGQIMSPSWTIDANELIKGLAVPEITSTKAEVGALVNETSGERPITVSFNVDTVSETIDNIGGTEIDEVRLYETSINGMTGAVSDETMVKTWSKAELPAEGEAYTWTNDYGKFKTTYEYRIEVDYSGMPGTSYDAAFNTTESDVFSAYVPGLGIDEAVETDFTITNAIADSTSLELEFEAHNDSMEGISPFDNWLLGGVYLTNGKEEIVSNDISIEDETAVVETYNGSVRLENIPLGTDIFKEGYTLNFDVYREFPNPEDNYSDTISIAITFDYFLSQGLVEGTEDNYKFVNGSDENFQFNKLDFEGQTTVDAASVSVTQESVSFNMWFNPGYAELVDMSTLTFYTTSLRSTLDTSVVGDASSFIVTINGLNPGTTYDLSKINVSFNIVNSEVSESIQITTESIIATTEKEEKSLWWLWILIILLILSIVGVLVALFLLLLRITKVVTQTENSAEFIINRKANSSFVKNMSNAKLVATQDGSEKEFKFKSTADEKNNIHVTVEGLSAKSALTNITFLIEEEKVRTDKTDKENPKEIKEMVEKRIKLIGSIQSYNDYLAKEKAKADKAAAAEKAKADKEAKAQADKEAKAKADAEAKTEKANNQIKAKETKNKTSEAKK